MVCIKYLLSLASKQLKTDIMELAIIKLQEELDYETHLLNKGFYKNKTQEDRDGTEQDCKNRILSYKKAIKTLSNA